MLWWRLLETVDEGNGEMEGYHRRTVTEKAPLACIQYPFRFAATGGPQDLVMYHGAPGWGWVLLLMSGAAWAWILTA